eukprot:TRINITY_DN5483_c0_g4_i1.p1 TRINITY_DN5483_c0_g4~~TRINITY_DN5483_c0_g4_i1.p1  ORF type:complete len:580 (-),score=86.83 TRINITY_DN5483_c0_g4_i1:53-1792(-)
MPPSVTLSLGFLILLSFCTSPAKTQVVCTSQSTCNPNNILPPAGYCLGDIRGPVHLPSACGCRSGFGGVACEIPPSSTCAPVTSISTSANFKSGLVKFFLQPSQNLTLNQNLTEVQNFTLYLTLSFSSPYEENNGDGKNDVQDTRVIFLDGTGFCDYPNGVGSFGEVMWEKQEARNDNGCQDIFSLTIPWRIAKDLNCAFKDISVSNTKIYSARVRITRRYISVPARDGIILWQSQSSYHTLRITFPSAVMIRFNLTLVSTSRTLFIITEKRFDLEKENWYVKFTTSTNYPYQLATPIIWRDPTNRVQQLSLFSNCSGSTSLSCFQEGSFILSGCNASDTLSIPISLNFSVVYLDLFMRQNNALINSSGNFIEQFTVNVHLKTNDACTRLISEGSVNAILSSKDIDLVKDKNAFIRNQFAYFLISFFTPLNFSNASLISVSEISTGTTLTNFSTISCPATVLTFGLCFRLGLDESPFSVVSETPRIFTISVSVSLQYKKRQIDPSWLELDQEIFVMSRDDDAILTDGMDASCYYCKLLQIGLWGLVAFVVLAIGYYSFGIYKRYREEKAFTVQMDDSML